MRALIAASLLAGLADPEPLLHLPAVPPRMAIDASPTAFACTLPKLVSDVRCTFEFAAEPAAPSPERAAANERRALEAARACPAAATAPGEHDPDPALLQLCEKEMLEAVSRTCGLQGQVPIEDQQGRWAVAAAPCAAELQGALARARTRAAVSLDCCRCLAQARCPVEPQICLREIHADLLSEPLQLCRATACEQRCSAIRSLPPGLLPPGRSDGPPPPPRKRNTTAGPALQKT